MATIETATNYISRKQLAKELGERLRGRPYSEFTLIAWEKDGKGPPVTRIGRDVVYRTSSVEAWLQAQERAAKQSANAA
jgi:predicted DNA-binding transcriptional regulator AlpA